MNTPIQNPSAIRVAAEHIRLIAIIVPLWIGASHGRADAFPGVQSNVPVAALSGWSLCYIDTYANGSTPLTTILSVCNKANLLLACRPAGSSNLSIAAHAPRADVIFDTGTSDTPHNANGVGWYFNSNYSWGFAPEGDPIDRSSCDIIASPIGPPGPDADKRLCWHTFGTLDAGWRCGAATQLFGNTYERLIFQADTVPCGNGVLDLGEQCDDGNLTAGDGCDSICRIEPCYDCAGQPSMCSPSPPGGACDDGLFCNGTDTCAADGCTIHAGDPCTGGSECMNACDENLDTCLAAQGAPCTDDGNQCTFDQCDGLGSCTHPDKFFDPCDDGLFCTGFDECFGGSCQFHDGDPCQFNQCANTCNEAAASCDPTAAGTPCFDDFNVCTSDQCDGSGFCVHPPVPSGTSCPNDGQVCTADQCDGAGVCRHPPLPAGTSCPNDGNDCTDDACNGAGVCAHPSLPDGTACDDANACTQTDSCENGFCAGSDPVVCMAPLCRSAGTCDPSTGMCSACPDGYTPGAGGCQRIYSIDAGMLTNLSSFCDGTGINRYNGCGSLPFGFQWNDAADESVGAVTRVDVRFDSGFDCFFSGPHTVRLNGASIGVYASTAAGTCSCVPAHIARHFTSVAPATYAKGGANSVSINAGDCSGISQGANGRYATVTVTYESPDAPFAIRDGCREAGRSKLKYRNSLNDAKDSVRWTWGHGEATTPAEFADPTASADYQFCVFAETSGAPSLLMAADVPADASLWAPSGDVGYKYLDPAAVHEGISRILLKRGAPTKSKIILKGKGEALGDPVLPVTGIEGIRVQLTNSSTGVCWESKFSAADIGGGINASGH